MIPPRITHETSIVAVIDVQEKLIATLPDRGVGLMEGVNFLVDVARILSVPIMVTEQYPKGLGHSVGTLTEEANIVEKTGFSGCAADTFNEQLKQHETQTIIVLGMEAHVCVLQTVLDLLRGDYRVIVAVDATASAFRLNAEMAFRRMEQAGATLSTVESIAFEWLGDAAHPLFKTVSRRLIEYRQTKAREPHS